MSLCTSRIFFQENRKYVLLNYEDYCLLLKKLYTMKLKKLKPVENLTQVDKIELSLQEFFKAENFQPGDSLPKEMELASAMGVSRTAIREALSRFRTLGIIESRKNRGMVMTEPDLLSNMQRVINTRLLNGETMKDIFELRLVLEVGLSELLFARKTKSNLDMLEQVVVKEEATTNSSELLKIDVEFHSTLYKISGNHTILRFQNMLLPIFDYVDHELHVKSQQITDNYVSHRVLLNTLRNGSIEEFQSNMRKHLSNYFEKI